MSVRTSLTYPLTSDDVRALVRKAMPVVAEVAPSAARPASRGSVLAIGAFDGVHLGHRSLIGACVEEARQKGLPSVVVTFDPDPSELLASTKTQRRLLAVDDRVALCRSLGVDRVVVLPFTHELAALEPIDFIDLLEDEMGPITSVHVGTNFRFGRGGRGTAETLRGVGERGDFTVVAHGLLEEAGAPVSSSRIRALLAEGDVAQAMELLGRPHFVRGTVAHGRGEGTSFGFPTANVCCDPLDCLPSEGVYACIVTDGEHAWPAAANVGAPPTFAERRAAFLEANLLGFSGDLYGRELAVIFVAWLRASRVFDSLEELERVVLGNIAWVRDNIGASEVGVGA